MADHPRHQLHADRDDGDVLPLLEELLTLREGMGRLEAEEQACLAGIAPCYLASARNLLHFIAFHRAASPRLAKALRERGLCSLAGCDAYLIAELTAVIDVLASLEGRSAPPPSTGQADPSLAALPVVGPPVSGRQEGVALMKSHCERLFGAMPATEAATIMVTLPTEAAHHPTLIRELVEAGMTIARINCAHDGPPTWTALVQQVRRASQATGSSCRIAMDLAGPKLRTGALPPLPGVVRARPRRDRFGRLLEPARIRAEPSPEPIPLAAAEGVGLPITDQSWQSLEPGDRLRGRDASGRWRELTVQTKDSRGLGLTTEQLCHFAAGQVFEAAHGRGRLVVAPLPPAPGEMVLRRGDRLRLTAAETGEPGAIPCSLPQVFADVRPGERILFDDGKIGGMIRAASTRELEVEITTARPRGSRLRADKGINLPDSHLHTPALTAKDIEDLAFATAHADLVSYSFVNREADVVALHQALKDYGREDLAVVLKIETRRAFLQLPRLLLAAMRYPAPLGVMIARGDLAIECGWDALAEIQEEILLVCEAAHVPCIWATQVLDEMARHGTPTRAEITDAAAGARAEALMLNKGPNITATVRALGRIVRKAHREPLQICRSFLAEQTVDHAG
jgi:pyruvate kinase